MPIYHSDTLLIVSKDLRIRGYFRRQKGREQKGLGSPDLGDQKPESPVSKLQAIATQYEPHVVSKQTGVVVCGYDVKRGN
jgi:hypothetical protein